MIEAINPEYIATAAKIVGAGIAYGMPGVMGVTILHHREETHRSIKTHPVLKKTINWLMRTYAPDDTDWSSVHRGHHFFRDVTIKPQHDITLAIEWAEANPDKTGGVKIPDTYPFLDPFVDQFSKDDVLTIGQQAKEIMRERAGGIYRPRESYSPQDLQRIFYPTEPKYYYEEPLKKGSDYTQDEIAEVLLGDPHSPARVRGSNGVKGVLRGNVRYYRKHAHVYRDLPEIKPKDLQTGEVIDHLKTRIKGFTETALLASGGVLLLNQTYSPEGVLNALLAGTAINTVALGLHLFGGNVTNSLGHAGVITSTKEFLQAIKGKHFKLTLNTKDGTLSTSTGGGGLLKKAASVFTLDETDGQDPHHKLPWKIAYTFKEGLDAWKEAPWGMWLTTLAHSRGFPFIKEGEGFPEGEQRPDMPHPTVLYIEQLRVEQAIKEGFSKSPVAVAA